MRCVCCDKRLNDYEATMKHPITGEYTDICSVCLPDTGIEPIVRSDLEPDEIVDALYYEIYDEVEDE